jgi:threonyl-tRNA synthetase
MEGKSYITKPIDLTQDLPQKQKETMVVAKVNNELWDLSRELEEDCEIDFLDMNDTEAKQVFWHSSSHLLGKKETINQREGVREEL